MVLKRICQNKDIVSFLQQIQRRKCHPNSSVHSSTRFSFCLNCRNTTQKLLYTQCTAQFSSSAILSKEILGLNETCSPQGIQGDQNCEINQLWHTNLTESTLGNHNDQLQGIQGSKKSLSQVLSEQDVLIRDIIIKIEAVSEQQTVPAVQGIQGDFSAFPQLNHPCPQGVQGEDCIQYKLWLENCYKYGIEDCIDQYEKFTAGRKTLQQIFAEQEKDIRDFARNYKVQKIQRRHFSTTTRANSKTEQDSKGIGAKTSDDSTKADDVELTGRQKLKTTIKDYGATVIVFHVSISLMSLGFFYTLVSSGLDVVKFLKMLGVGESIIQGQLAKGATTFALAYAVHKVFAPVRIATTVTCTPLIVRYLRNKGILKTPGKSN